ncbi:hypothetical protein [Rubinisphaera sp.]|uniref:type IV pilus modification PilV family protein n=1 Tax=Rubinisphaera sp. TaxID=2024857 RepID=UPI0025F55FBC|nr:hypothetical protein [Rubinisphaera sp.]
MKYNTKRRSYFGSKLLTQLENSRNNGKACQGAVGATLVEILMAMMVMSIGLVSVASLFPVAILRSVQATQLTNAALQYRKCEDYLRAFPDLTRNHFDGTRVRGNYEFTPDSVTWNRRGAPTNIFELQDREYTTVIDPLGALRFSQQGVPGFPIACGGDPYGLHPDGGMANDIDRYGVDRTNGGFNMSLFDQRSLAYEIFASRDSWSMYSSSVEVSPPGGVYDSLQLNDMTIDSLNELNNSYVNTVDPNDRILVRAIVISKTGKQSHTSLVNGVDSANRRVSLVSPLPNNGLYSAIPEVRLEIFELRYTSLITVSKRLRSFGADNNFGDATVDDDGDGTADNNFYEVVWPGSDDDESVQVLEANLVIFFRRTFSTLNEQVYGVEGMGKGSTQAVKVFWDGSIPDSKPRIEAGEWVFDVRNGHWYQIRTVLLEEGSGTSSLKWISSNNNRFAIVELDRPAESTASFLMFVPNVLEVVRQIPITSYNE